MTSVPVRGEFVRPDGGRKRLYSWSRPSRDIRTSGPRAMPRHSEHCIAGLATIAFHPSGEWFQGNVISRTDDAYTVYGRKRLDRQGRFDRPPPHRLTSCREDSEESAGDSSSSSSGGASLPHSRSGDSPVACSCSPDDQASVCDSLDSELIREAMESLELSLVAEGQYNVTIIDYETGLNHHFKGVCLMMEGGDSLTLESEQLSFSSTTSYKGNKADVVITSSIGPSLAEIGMTVFRGEMRVNYTEEPCYPVTLDESRWCL